MTKMMSLTKDVKTAGYLCINKNIRSMSMELKKWIEGSAEIEALICDLVLEPISQIE